MFITFTTSSGRVLYIRGQNLLSLADLDDGTCTIAFTEGDAVGHYVVAGTATENLERLKADELQQQREAQAREAAMQQIQRGRLRQ